MAETIAEKVSKYMTKNPKASNEDLYAAFPEVRKNTLRHYKSKFAEPSSAKNTAKSKRGPKPKTSAKVKAASKTGSKTPRAKTTPKKSKGSKLPLSRQIFDYLDQNPQSTNQDLYEAFEGQSKSSIRGYKAAYFKNLEESKPKPGRVEAGIEDFVNRAQKVKDRINETIHMDKAKLKTLSKTELEKKILELEEKVDQIVHFLHELGPVKGRIKDFIKNPPGNLDKRVKDLEENLLSFINEKKSKVSHELKSLEELQQVVSSKIGNFLNSIKNRKDS